MYQFCRTFKCTPSEYYSQTAEDVDILLLTEQEAKSYEIEEMERKANGR